MKNESSYSIFQSILRGKIFGKRGPGRRRKSRLQNLRVWFGNSSITVVSRCKQQIERCWNSRQHSESDRHPKKKNTLFVSLLCFENKCVSRYVDSYVFNSSTGRILITIIVTGYCFKRKSQTSS